MYCILDSDNRPIGFYHKDIHTNIPTEAINITDEQYRELLDYNTERVLINGEVKIASKKIEAIPPDFQKKMDNRSKRDGLINRLSSSNLDTDLKETLVFLLTNLGI